MHRSGFSFATHWLGEGGLLDARCCGGPRALSTFPRSRLLLCPGNHDYGASGILYDEASARSFDQFASPYCSGSGHRTRTPHVHILEDATGFQVVTIGLNATLEIVSPLDMAEGQVGPEQLEALDAILGNPDLRALPKLVYLHFHPYEQRRGMKLLDPQELLDCLRNRVSVLCVGHSHRQEESHASVASLV